MKMDQKIFWTSETQMYYDREEVVSAKNNIIQDINGKEYLDLNSGTWNVILGHGRKEYVDSIPEQLQTLEYSPNIRFTNNQANKLAKRLISNLSDNFTHVFFTSGGAEAVETALKLARGYFYEKKEGAKRRIISLYESYHGSTLGAMSASGDPWDRIPFDPILKDTLKIYPQYCYKCRLGLNKTTCKYACLKDFQYQIDFYGAENICACILEPIMGVGGVIIPDAHWIKTIVDTCHKNNILVIFDEISCGTGRTGKFFACQDYGIYPDMILFGKGISNGTQPLAGVIIDNKIYNQFLSPDRSKQFRHGFTNSGHPVACASGNTTLDIFEKEDVLSIVKDKESKFSEILLKELSTKNYIGEIRIKGLMIAIELKNPFTGADLNIDNLDIILRDKGVIMSQMCQVACFMPSVVTTEDELKKGLRVLCETVENYLQISRK